MKNSIIIIGIFFLTAFICKAQEEKTFKIKANWKKGDVKEMCVQQSGSWTMSGQVNTFPIEIKAKYSITIIDKSEKGYIVEWKILNNDNELEQVEFMKEYISKFKYVIETDLNGHFKELSNWESLVELNRNLKDKITSEAEKENIDQIELENMIGQMKLAETKGDLVEMCLELTDIFHGSYGEEFQLNDTIIQPTTISNQHFNDGIPATLVTIAKELDNDRISITYSYVFDYEKLKEIYKKQFPDHEYNEQKMSSYTEFIFNKKTGWIEKITFYNEFEQTAMKNTTIIEHIIK